MNVGLKYYSKHFFSETPYLIKTSNKNNFIKTEKA